MMTLKKAFFAVPGILFCSFFTIVQAQEIPADYKLLYEQDFEDKSSFDDFEKTDDKAWQFGEGKEGGQAMELYGKSEYTPPVRSPHNIAFIKGRKFGSFILEADLLQTGEEYGHRDLCIFFGLKDPSNFYYVHLASVADPNAHNIFIVNDAPRTNIATKTNEGINWGAQKWHKVRLERDVETGTVRVFFDDMETPVMEAEDKHFNFGFIGFGSFDDTGKIDNIKIWGRDTAPAKEGFF